MEQIVKVSVKQEHIDCGQPIEGGSCPLALAIRGTLPDAHNVSVGSYSAFVETKNDGGDYKLPAEAVKFISDFDDCGMSKTLSEHRAKFKPFEFEMTLKGEW